MTFLELCQECNTYCGFQSSISATATATGLQARIVQAVKKADLDIQRERYNWNFLRTSTTFNTSDGTNEYTLAALSVTDLGRWKTDKILYDYKPLNYIDYDYWILKDLTATQSGSPGIASVNPATKALLLYPIDGVYSITAHYWKEPQVMTVDASLSDIPQKHHWAIIYKAAASLMAGFGNASVHQDASLEYSKAWGNLMRDENPSEYIKMRPMV